MKTNIINDLSNELGKLGYDDLQIIHIIETLRYIFSSKYTIDDVSKFMEYMTTKHYGNYGGEYKGGEYDG